MRILTYAQIVALTEKMVETREYSFSKADYNDIVYSCVRNIILARLLQAYPPLKFQLFYDRSRQAELAERQAELARGGEPQQIINVHDPLFSDSRRATRLWLQKQEGVASVECIQASLQTEHKLHFLTLFEQQLSKGLITTLYPQLGEEKHIKVTQDFRDFIEYLFGSYQAGATGGDTTTVESDE